MALPSACARLRNGASIPLFGLGTWRAEGAGECYRAVSEALRLGYRLIDTAAMYANEEDIGRAIRDSGVPRDQIFVVTKLHMERHDNPERELRASLERLALPFVDMYLIHSPNGGRVVEVWKELLRLRDAGLTRMVGVSNFGPAQLAHIKQLGLEMPLLNQFELHVWLQQREAVSYCNSEGIVVMGYCPLARGARLGADAQQTGPVWRIAHSHNKTAAQTALRWSYQSGVVTIPKSTSPARLAENCAIFDFSLSDAEMEELRSVDEGLHVSVAVRAMDRPWEEICG